jgi:hypothetical protein
MRSRSWEGLPGSAVRTMSRWPLPSGAGPGVAIQGELTDERVAVVLGAIARTGDLMGGPPGAEVGIVHGELAD